MPNVIRTKTIPERIRHAYLTQKRRKAYSMDYFLYIDDVGDRKFPYRDPDTGGIHCGLLKAAITRAAQYGYSWVEERAILLYKKYCKVKKEHKDYDIKICKEFEGIVLGIVAMPGIVDKQGDEITKEAIEKACWEYNTEYGAVFYRHGMPLTSKEVELLESYVAPTDMKIGEHDVPAGTWLVRVKINDDKIKKEVLDGNIQGFSMGGIVIDGE